MPVDPASIPSHIRHWALDAYVSQPRQTTSYAMACAIARALDAIMDDEPVEAECIEYGVPSGYVAGVRPSDVLAAVLARHSAG